MDKYINSFDNVVKEILKFKKNIFKKISTQYCIIEKLKELYSQGHLTEKLILSLKLKHLGSLSLETQYINKKGYWLRMKRNDIKNGHTERAFKKPAYTKYQTYKKADLIKEIHRLDHMLWNRTFLLRQLELKHNVNSEGMIIFD